MAGLADWLSGAFAKSSGPVNPAAGFAGAAPVAAIPSALTGGGSGPGTLLPAITHYLQPSAPTGGSGQAFTGGAPVPNTPLPTMHDATNVPTGASNITTPAGPAKPWDQPGYYPPASAGAPGSPGYVAAWNQLHPDNINSSPLGYASDGSPMAPPTPAAMQRMLPQGATMQGAMTLVKPGEVGPSGVPGDHNTFTQNYTPAGGGPNRTFGVLADGPNPILPTMRGTVAPPASAGPGGAQMIPLPAVAPATALARAATSQIQAPAAPPQSAAVPMRAPANFNEAVTAGLQHDPNMSIHQLQGLSAAFGGRPTSPVEQALQSRLGFADQIHDKQVADARATLTGPALVNAINRADQDRAGSIALIQSSDLFKTGMGLSMYGNQFGAPPAGAGLPQVPAR